MAEDAQPEQSSSRTGFFLTLLLTFVFLLGCWYCSVVWNETKTISSVKLLRVSVVEEPIAKCFNTPSAGDFACLISKQQPDLKIPTCNLTSSEYHSDEYQGSSLRDWERISFLLNRMKVRSDTKFVDVGAKLGTHTIAVAQSSMTKKVVGMGFTDLDLRLFRMTVCLGDLTGYITLINGIVSETNKYLPYIQFRSTESDDGTGELQKIPCVTTADGISCNSVANIAGTETGDDSNTVNVNELNEIISKIVDRRDILDTDPDGDEYSKNMADRLFDLLNIPFVQQKFHSNFKLLQESEKNLKKTDLMVKYYFSRNYTAVFSDDIDQLLVSDWTSYPGDVPDKLRK